MLLLINLLQKPFRLERISGGLQFNLLPKAGLAMRLTMSLRALCSQVLKSPEGWDCTTFWQLSHCLTVPIWGFPLLSLFKIVAIVSLLCTLLHISSQKCRMSTLRYPKSPLLDPEQAMVHKCLLTDLFDNFWLSWTCPVWLYVFPPCSQNWMPYSRYSLMNSK